LAANPWIECMIAPFYFRIFTHHKSPKVQSIALPETPVSVVFFTSMVFAIGVG
jgi:hypothetical protein